jgi:hypothetical protein
MIFFTVTSFRGKQKIGMCLHIDNTHILHRTQETLLYKFM